MDKKPDKNDKRPTSRLISSFEDSQRKDGGFAGERTIPGDFSLPEHTEHDHDMDGGYPSGTLADLIDPSLDGQTVDNELPDFTQTDLRAVEQPDPVEQRAHEEMQALIMDSIAVIDGLSEISTQTRERGLDSDAVDDLELLRARFLDSLGTYGVREDSSLGMPFDPELHEIVREMPVTSDDRDGMVIQVEKPGYTRNGHPLRRARVIVGKKG